MLLQKEFAVRVSSVLLMLSLSSGVMANHAKNEFHKHRSMDKALKGLSTYQQLDKKLARIKRKSRRPIQVGPLIRNGDNKGLIDIDIPLDQSLSINHEVCGGGHSVPSIRNAVVCTLNDQGRGNTDPTKIGQSTQGRALLAARLGNRAGTRVMIITQQHGNEPAGTEAAVKVLRWLTRSHRKAIRNILRKLDLLVLVRANPDGGEPDSLHCELDPLPGRVITKDCALIRQSVDATAGGAFASDSEADFSGIVGRGYDLNRYHHVGLDKPIRPIESQAMVAAALAFQPLVILDLHGDLHKTDCHIDFDSILPGQVLGLFPTGECAEPDQEDDVRLMSPFADAKVGSEQENLVKSLAVDVMDRVDEVFDGSVGRFSQVQFGSGNIGSGSAATYQVIGAGAGGWETANFSYEVRSDVTAVVDGQAVIGLNPGLPDPDLLKQQIRINRVALISALKSLAKFADNPPIDGADFCDYPLASGLIASLPEKYWGDAATESNVLVPISPAIGVPLYISGNCPDSPLQ
ncbi:M14 family zinc carboxypeptidase [Motiliproteus sp. MSK22-1]|uniref:M14 family zinc carboxypeptidase n=1 Tax=Motiliproteus sp. MSK22-1 TaxID=1897630 RepID=UPI0009756376|nr:M14 family zinc carboxypeptidase [Motiliproteus sp. MSK22-1]OMH25759.1 hypothetical protein BGP75_24845 [Motiliproteus sp. MSK22-1]